MGNRFKISPLPKYLSSYLRHPRPASRTGSSEQGHPSDYPKEDALVLFRADKSLLDQEFLAASFLLGDNLALVDDAAELMLANESIIFKV